jgi:hypothetical protein
MNTVIWFPFQLKSLKVAKYFTWCIKNGSKISFLFCVRMSFKMKSWQRWSLHFNRESTPFFLRCRFERLQYSTSDVNSDPSSYSGNGRAFFWTTTKRRHETTFPYKAILARWPYDIFPLITHLTFSLLCIRLRQSSFCLYYGYFRNLEQRLRATSIFMFRLMISILSLFGWEQTCHFNFNSDNSQNVNS